MPKNFTQFKNNLNEWIGIEKIKDEDIDPSGELPKNRRRSDVSPERYMYDRSLDPADAGDTKKRGFLTHLMGAAKGVLKKVGREFVASTGEALAGNIGRDMVKNAYTAKDIDKHRDIRVQQIKAHQKHGMALNADIQQLNKQASATQDPEERKRIQDQIKRKKQDLVARNQTINDLERKNKFADRAKVNLKKTGDIEGDDIMRYSGDYRSSGSGSAFKGSRKGSGKLGRTQMMSLMRDRDPNLYKKVREFRKRQFGSDAVADMPES